MINVNVGHAAFACVAMGAAALSLTACSSNTAKGGAPSSASASIASVAATSSPTAVTAATSVVPTSTAPATTGGGAASAAPNPCTLVTAADVSSSTGHSVSAGIHQTAGLYDACIYGSGGLVILVRTIDHTIFDTSAKANPGGAIPVSGVGDDAYNASGTLLVWKAGTEIVIGVKSGSGDPLTTEKKLATAAVARL